MKTAYATLILIFIYLAAVNIAKQKPTFVSKPNHHQYEKAKGEFLLEIISSIDHPANENEEYELSAHISPLGYATQAEFKWALPENIEIVSGNLNGTVTVSQEESTIVKIEVRQKNKNNGQIFFEATTYNDGIKLGGAAQFNSVYQPAIDEHLESNKQKAEFLQEQGFQHKVIQ